MSLLLSEIKIGSQVFKNRIVMSPMCQYSSVDGYASDWHLVHLGSRAVGGAGLIIQEATAVSPIGRISPDDLGLWEDGHKASLRRIVEFIHQQGSKIGIQLAHAGRKSSTSSIWKGNRVLNEEEGGWRGVAPSAIPFNHSYATPDALSTEDIQEVIRQFVQAAVRAADIGYDVIEIHAAHGYLLHEFMSPISNQRTDHYGGTFENRTRMLLECVRAVRERIPAAVGLFIRISAVDYLDGGWNIDQSVQLARQLEDYGVDLIDVSSGAIAPGEQIPVHPGYQVPFAAEIKAHTDLKVGAVGLILTSLQAESILQSRQADMIFLGRELLRDPYFALHAAQQLDGDNIYPDQYLRAFYQKKK